MNPSKVNLLQLKDPFIYCIIIMNVMMVIMLIFANSAKSKSLHSSSLENPKIDLFFTEKNWNKIESRVKKYKNQRLISSEGNDDYLPATIILNDKKKIRVKVKIKGKEIDHISRGNISFRIKVIDEDNTHILGMKDFSLQRFERRSPFSPFLHHLLYKNNALSFRYISVRLSINNKKYHHYVIEERPNKEFQEHNKRKESVIFAISDNETWEQKLIDRNLIHKTITKESQRLPITTYSYSKIRKSPTLKSYAEEGFSLLWGYRLGALSFEDVFDLDKFAKAAVIADGLCDSHPLIDHINIRYYYNPYLRKLEPIILTS